MTKYIIIGNSTAAIGAIEGIRSIDKTGSITVISKEKQHTYSRPLISYLLQGKTDRQKIKFRSDDFYQKNDCITLFGKTVISIDKDKKTVRFSDNEVLSYDKLLIATGSRAFVPPFKGIETIKNKFTFMSLDDAESIENAMKESSNVLIVGAGLIGLKCAEGIVKKVKSVTVVDIADKILPSILDEESSKIVKSHIEEYGIKFLLKDGVAEFNENTAVLSSGTKIEFDMLIIAVGVRPNTELIKDIGGNVNRGIITDSCGKTSIDGIYSAGDCCESFDITTGESKILALLPNAYMQGNCSGINMAGGDFKFEKAIAMNAIGFFGLHIITAGSYIGESFTTVKDKTYKKLFYKDNMLKGYIMTGDIDRAGIYTSLIREQTQLDSIDFELIKEKPQLMAFNKNERSKFLGEVRI